MPISLKEYFTVMWRILREIESVPEVSPRVWMCPRCCDTSIDKRPSHTHDGYVYVFVEIKYHER